MNIILCGLPMCGKSTISKMLAERLNRSCVDTDRLIERTFARKYGAELSCREIYLTVGAAVFRQLEACEIFSLMKLKECVIAVGGGSFHDPANIVALRKAGRIVYLKADIATLWQRMSYRQNMPAYLNHGDPENDFYALAKKRIPLYEFSADMIIDTSNRHSSEIVNEICPDQRSITLIGCQ